MKTFDNETFIKTFFFCYSFFFKKSIETRLCDVEASSVEGKSVKVF